MKLVQSVQKHHSGIYRCEASNIYGTSASEGLNIVVKCKNRFNLQSTLICFIILDLPVCKTNQETILVVKRNQLAVLSCEMDANPIFNMKFSWTFNTTNFSSNLKVSNHMVPFIVT